MVLDEFISSFINFEIEPSLYTLKYLSEALLKIIQQKYERHHDAIDIEFDDITMKTKLVVRPDNIAKRFQEKSFF